MFATLNIYIMTYSRKEDFDANSQELAKFFRVLSHPARVAILKYLAEQKQCFSGDITDEIPLSRTTVSQHLQELKNSGLIQGTITGTRVNYCLCGNNISKAAKIIEEFLKFINIGKIECDC
ncbi:MAG: metalloregulator ArsR/SmtB family transcription factor [Bacteroidetes bacterium]|nr:metalloregulator ArsR/SmtB family transcription factor [Bacteroidota bacterium]